MKFSDKIERSNLTNVFVIRTEAEMEAREEYNSNLWEVKAFLKKINSYLYSVPARDVKIGESIYSENAKYIAYRSE